MKEHEFISPPGGTGGENQKKKNHLWFKQKNEHHTMSEEDRKGDNEKVQKIICSFNSQRTGWRDVVHNDGRNN